MNQPPEPSSIYQLRIVLREISPLISRRLLVCSDTTLAHLHTILQIVFDWSGEHLHTFHIHGKDYGSNGANTRLCRSACCVSVAVSASGICMITAPIGKLTSVLKQEWPLMPHVFLRCVSLPNGRRRLRSAGGPGRIWRGSISIALIRLLKPCWSPLMPSKPCETRTPRPRSGTPSGEAVGGLDALQDAVDCLEAYQQFQPERVDRRAINTQLRTWL